MRRNVAMSLILLTPVALTGCNSTRRNGLQNHTVCSKMVAAMCDFAIRCETWASTADDCQVALATECCDGESCQWPAETTLAHADACAARVRGSTCDDPLLFEDCSYSSLLGSQPEPTANQPDDGPPRISLADAGISSSPQSGLYDRCFSDRECSAVAEGCFELSSGHQMCTKRCNTSSDCPVGAECLFSNYRDDICVPRCNGDADCPRELRCDYNNRCTD